MSYHFRPPVIAQSLRIAVIIPCYRVTSHVRDVISRIGPEVDSIYCVDDACPDGSGSLIEDSVADPRIVLVRHASNEGVGGAVLTGYRRALEDGHDILIKVDGDGQMDPALIPQFVDPIASGRADYTKGNRFFNMEDARGMPIARLIGNGALSFLTKLSSGYWNIFDPTNGYTAIHRSVAELIIRRSIDKGYFFETDMLLNLYLVRAVVQDVPMTAVYADERSSLQISRIAFPFLVKSLKNAFHRSLVNYVIRDFSLATLEAFVGLVLLAFGLITGSTFWLKSYYEGKAATAGQVMIAALPILSGTQLFLSALNFDMRNVPTVPLQRLFGRTAR